MIPLYIREHTGFRQAHPTEILAQAQELLAQLRVPHLGESLQTQQSRDFIRAHIGSRDQELVGMLHLDIQHRLGALEDLHYGKLSEGHISTRHVLHSVMTHKASAVILFHSHPHGPADLTDADRHLFHRLLNALAIVEVRLLDYLILADTIRSLRENQTQNSHEHNTHTPSLRLIRPSQS